MSSAIASRILSFLALVSALFLTACGPARNSTQTRSTGTQNVSQSSCSTGVIYNENQDGLSYSARSFQDRVGDFVSATLAASDLGQVSGSKTSKTNYISLSGKAKFDSNGQLNASQSSLKILIYDSLVGSLNGNGEKVTAYPVTIESASNGQMDANGNFTVVYQDNYGSITLTGKSNSGQITGRIDFANSTAVDNYGPRSGVLGAFTISTCAFF